MQHFNVHRTSQRINRNSVVLNRCAATLNRLRPSTPQRDSVALQLAKGRSTVRRTFQRRRHFNVALRLSTAAMQLFNAAPLLSTPQAFQLQLRCSQPSPRDKYTWHYVPLASATASSFSATFCDGRCAACFHRFNGCIATPQL